MDKFQFNRTMCVYYLSSFLESLLKQLYSLSTYNVRSFQRTLIKDTEIIYAAILYSNLFQTTRVLSFAIQHIPCIC